MKICTNIEQSKKLAEFLPKENADMYWSMDEIPFLAFPVNDIVTDWEYAEENGMLPAWSLAALLEVLPYPTLYQQGDGAWGLDAWVEQVKPYSVKNAICEVDACVEMILKLHELNIL